MKISLIVPVYKEGSAILAQIKHLKSQISGKINYEIVVSDGEYSTLEYIKDEYIIKVKSKKGRGQGLIDGVKNSSGDVFIFVHSDTRMPKNFDLEIKKMVDSGVDVGAFDLSIDSKKTIFRVIEKIASLRSRITKIPYGDQSIFCTKQSYEQIGGFENYSLMEDVNFMQKAKKQNLKISISKMKVVTSSRRWDKEGVFYVTIRNWILVTLYYFGVKPDILVNWYTSFRNLKFLKK